MEKKTIVGLIVSVSAILIMLVVAGILGILGSQASDQEACQASILLAWKSHSTSIISPWGRFRHPGFYGCKTTYAIINQRGIYVGNKPLVNFRELKDKDKINDAIMHFLADEMAKCWSTFYEGDSNLFDFNDIMKRVYGDTGEICITCDDVNIEYLPYGNISYSDFMDYLKNHYINVTHPESNKMDEESYYDFLYKENTQNLQDLQVSFWNVWKTNFHSITDIRNILRSGNTNDINQKKVVATLKLSLLPDESSPGNYYASKPKGYYIDLGGVYTPKGTNLFFSCDKDILYETNGVNQPSPVATGGNFFCFKDKREVLSCNNSNVVKLNTNKYCLGNSLYNCTVNGPVKVESCAHGCEFSQCATKQSSSYNHEPISKGDYNILFYVVGKPIYYKTPVPFILLINSKDLFTSCSWLSLR